jgi:hypothetical protein
MKKVKIGEGKRRDGGLGEDATQVDGQEEKRRGRGEWHAKKTRTSRLTCAELII